MLKSEFNQDWEYKKKDSGEWSKITLPHDAMLYEEREPDCSNGPNTGFYPGGKYTYRKNFYFADEVDLNTAILEFEGVYQKSEIYINGKCLFEHHYGYTGFFVDISSELKVNSQNEIRVEVDNSEEPNSRWYSGSGIYRPVNLYTGKTTYIKPNGVFITAEDENIEIEVDYVSELPDCFFRVDIAKDGKTIKSKEFNSGLNSLNISSPEFWDIDTPNLYRASISVFNSGKLLDTHETEFGIRKITFSAEHGFCINGKSVNLRGACIHHDNGILGAASYYDAEKRKVRILKEAGFNAIRSSHNPASRDLLRVCDELGMYVIDETFDQWYIHKTKYDYASCFEKEWETDTIALVQRDYNHPSVVMYSIGNEVSETAQEKGIALTRAMTESIRNIDGTRPVTCGINLFLNGLVKLGKGIYQEESSSEQKVHSKKQGNKKSSGSEFVNIFMTMMGSFMNNLGRFSFVDKVTRDAFRNLDIAGYNYGSGRYRIEKRKHPERVIVGSETFPPDIAKNWKMVEQLPYLIGDFIWTGIDYLGEAGLGSFTYPGQGEGQGLRKEFPWLLSGAGVIDLTGLITPRAKYNQIVWGDVECPVIAVTPLNLAKYKPVKSMWRDSDVVESWSWDGFEGEKTNIEVYCRSSYVELFLNGSSLGTKKTGEEKKFKAVYKNIVYQPGILRAVSMNKQRKVLSESNLKTAGKDTRIHLEVDRENISPNIRDLLYVEICLTDEKGIIKPLEEKDLTISVSGAGELLGFGSANPCTEEGFINDRHRTYFGRALAVVRAASYAGEVIISVYADGCETVNKSVFSK